MLGTIVEDRYLVEAELGAGAMGHVYRARHVKVGRQVAIKVMHPELARVPTIVERFAREARIAARLDHPNLVCVLDVGMTPGSARLPLLVLELAPGTSLVELALDPLPREQVVSLVRQLLRGLDHAHDAGLIHRDLKPDNILVEQLADGTLVPRIVDFGIAVYSGTDDPIAGRRFTEANTVIGTPLYMSPEQAMAKPVDARTDLFSLGVIMYELLAGMPPFDGSGVDVAYANATKDAPAIAERAGIDVDPLLEAFVKKLMARRLSDRFQSAHEALQMLDLIDADRIAAARALSVCAPATSTVALDDASPPTHAFDDDDEQVLLLTPSTRRRSTEVTRVEHIAGTRPTRRRALWAGAIAAAALTAVVGWSAPRTAGAQLRAPVATASSTIAEPVAPTLRADVSPPLRANVASAPTPSPAAAPTRAKAPRTAQPSGPTKIAAAPHEALAPESGLAATPAAAPAEVTGSANDLAARYIAVGRRLRGASDDLWSRYRLIRINEALASEASRKQTFVILADIEQAIRK